MFQNFKTDIIYYNTLTDFELEFNLCGCCSRMRLLSDKCNDKKTLLLSLSRAVSRSRVVIVTTPIFNDENIVNTIANAIGKKMETINNKDFNIASNAEISIIKDSVPLVTADGIFGGCIIESGPQSLIILTDSKPIRKTLMKTLIHPYIEEIYALEVTSKKPELTEETQNEEEQPLENIIDENEIMPDSTEDENQTDLIQNDSENEETTPDNPTESQTDIYSESKMYHSPNYYTEGFQDLYIETEPKKRKKNISYDDDDSYYYENNYFTEESSQMKSPILSRWLLIISIIVLLAIAVLCFSIFYVPSTEGVSPVAYVKDVFDTMFG